MSGPLIVSPHVSPARAMALRDEVIEGEVIDQASWVAWKRERAEFDAWKRGEKGRALRKKNEDRNANDAYFTPVPLARAICEQLAKILPAAPLSVLEPSVGAGAFLGAIRRTWPNALVGIEDIDKAGLAKLRADRCGSPGSTGSNYELIVGNPPYLEAERHVRVALERLAFGAHLAFLLRIGFISSQERAVLYQKNPIRFLVPIIGRPSFTDNGKTDASEYAVFVWRRGFTGHGEILPGLTWERGL